MASWADIQNEIMAGTSPEAPIGNFDGVRRAKYDLAKGITGRPLLVYATAFHNPIKSQAGGPFLSIDFSDKDGFAEIIRGIEDKKIDVFIHSPGGSPEATESIVKMMRAQFQDVRFIITGMAKSAATMMALSGNEILMSQAAELGPIDPQVRVRNRFSPAGSIIEQFDRAAEDLKKDPNRIPVWMPILQEYAPALLVECENFMQLSKTLVKGWLSEYMFKKDVDKAKKARKVAAFLANEKKTLSHARRVDYNQLKKMGVKVSLLEDQTPELQDAINQLHLAIMATLDGTNAVKIFENSEGGALIRNINM